MNAHIFSGHYRHHKFVQCVAILRLNNRAVPFHRSFESICTNFVRTTTDNSRQHRPRPLHTLQCQQDNRGTIRHLCSITLPPTWLKYHCASACHCQTRLYMSTHAEALPPMPERGEKAIKRLDRDKCKIEFFHSRHDFRDYNERSRGYEDSREDMDDRYHNGIFTVHFSSNAIEKTAIEYYNNDSKLVREQLEYFTKYTKRWKKFPFDNITSDPEIKYYRGKGSRPIPLRVKSEYEDSDDEDETSNTREKVIAIGEDKPKVLEMLTIIKNLSLRLGGFEFQRTTEDKYKMSSKFHNMGAPLLISDWLKHQMIIDEELSGIALRQPGALQHITTCFAEFDELWDHEKDPFYDEEDEMEKYRKPSKSDVRPRGRQKKKKKKEKEKKQKKKKPPRPEKDESLFLPSELY